MTGRRAGRAAWGGLETPTGLASSFPDARSVVNTARRDFTRLAQPRHSNRRKVANFYAIPLLDAGESKPQPIVDLRALSETGPGRSGGVEILPRYPGGETMHSVPGKTLWPVRCRNQLPTATLTGLSFTVRCPFFLFLH